MRFISLRLCLYISSEPTVKDHPKLNGAIYIKHKTLRYVVSSAAEAEVGGIFHNTQVALPIRNILHTLNHSEPLTSLKIDTITAKCFIYNNTHQKRSKSWDMIYYWLCDHQTQQQFCFYRDKGSDNHEDYL